jgi:hypothetical protein
LYVDGTQFIVNSTTIELADLRVGIATTVGTNLLLDGGGIGIGSANILKTITWNNSASALTSSEDWNLVTGKQYEINNTPVLSSTTLGSGVVNSSLTSVGTLGQLNVSGISSFRNGNSTYGTSTALSAEFGVNTTAAGAIKLHGTTSNAYGLIQATNSNLHIDCVVGGTYLNFYDGDFVSFGTGAGAESGRFTGSTGTLTLGSTGSTGTASQRLQVTGGAYVSGNVGLGTVSPSYKLEVEGSRAWIKPNSDGTEAIALSLGRFSDSNTAFYDILTNDASGDVAIHRINRYTGTWNFRRTSPTGEVNGLSFTSSFTSGTSVSIGNSVGNTQVYLYTNGNSYFNNDGAVLVGSATSTGTANQKLQVTGGAYVSGDVGIGTTNPTFPLTVNGNLYFEPNSNGYIRGNDSSQNGLNGSFLLIGTSGSSIDAGVHLRGGQSTTNDWSIYQKGSDNTLRIRADNATEPFVITNNGDVGINTTNPQYKLHVVGSFGATTKSFIIDHPTQEGKKLQYGSLEGPELGVYVRGRTQSSIIELPDYWTGLVDEETITVNLTPIGRKAPPHSVIDIVDNTVEIESANDVIDCFYTVFAERKDVPKLEVEF